MKRRKFIGLIGGAVTWPVVSRAQQVGRNYRVASVWLGGARSQYEVAFLDALRDHGYVVRHNLEYEARYALADMGRLPTLIDEVIALKPDVLVVTERVARLVNKASTIPIVLLSASDPVAAGLVNSFSSPGGNVTGTSVPYSELNSKQIDILREMIPRLERVADMLDVNVPGFKYVEENTRGHARKLGVEYTPYHVKDREGIEKAFADLEKRPSNALLQGVGSALLFINRQRIIYEAQRSQIAVSSSHMEYIARGALISYGPPPEEGFRLGASFVDKILKGASPGGLPMEQLKVFELVINLRTAKALGLSVPQPLLARANSVVE